MNCIDNQFTYCSVANIKHCFGDSGKKRVFDGVIACKKKAVKCNFIYSRTFTFHPRIIR